VHPADLSAFMLSVRTAANICVWTHEFRIVLKNGEERWMAGEASPERQEDGSLLWHGCFMDQTRSKQTERSLITAEQQRRLVMQASNQGLYDINLNTGAATFSPEYSNMIEHSIEEFADPFAFWDYFWKHSVHPDDVAGIKKPIASILRRRQNRLPRRVPTEKSCRRMALDYVAGGRCRMG
jgi:PAS domain-containing protein